jgi:hypothetical protein
MGGLRPSGSRPPVSTGPPPTGYFAGGDRALARRESAAANPYDNRGPYASQEALAGIEPGEGQQQGAEDGQQQPAPDFSGVQPGQVPLDAGQRQPRRPGEAAAPVQPAPRTRQRAGFGSAGSIGGFGSQRQQQVPPSGGQPAGFGRQGVGPQASNIIQRLLTTPRPGGLQGLQQQNAAMANQPAAFPEGIAGVASKAEDHGVRVYRGKENYNEWEFVYDYREEEGLEGIVGGAAGGGLAPGQPGTSASGILGGAATQGGGIVPAGVSAPIPGQAAPAGFPGQPQNPNDPRGGFGRQGPSIFYPPTAPIGAPGGGPYPGQPPVQPGPGTPPEPNPTTPQTQPNNRTGRRLPNSRFGGQTYPNQPQPQR